MLTAYFDESGSAEDEKELVLAGYVQRASVWATFSDDWQEVLNRAPRIDYFHMCEAESKKGVFEGWDQPMVRQKVSDLADVIVKHQLWSVECRMSVHDFRAILEPVAPFDLKNPYFYLFAGVADSLARLHKDADVDSPVDIVMDQHQASPYVVGLFPALKHYMPESLSKYLGDSPTFRDDKKVLPLQAADMLAWHLRRSGERRNAREKRRVHAKLLPILHTSMFISRDILEHMAKQMSEVPGLEHVQGRRGSIILSELPPVREKRVETHGLN